jgi:hypothetical protein
MTEKDAVKTVRNLCLEPLGRMKFVVHFYRRQIRTKFAEAWMYLWACPLTKRDSTYGIMNKNITIYIGDHSFEAELFDTPTGRAIEEALPFETSALTWGDEIYFSVPAHAPLEKDARAEVAVGDLAYWPAMPAFCIFFGPTPASIGKEPRAASSVNVFGRLKAVDLDTLRAVSGGETARVAIEE